MITSIDSFLAWFDGVNRRTIRDVSVLPEAARTWVPPAAPGETGWGVTTVVTHIAMVRLFSVSAYLGNGWSASQWRLPTESVED